MMRAQLTWPWMRDALYCCSPVGLSQLAEHLRMRGIEFDASDMSRVLGDAIQRGEVISKPVPFGGVTVPLFALPGYGL